MAGNLESCIKVFHKYCSAFAPMFAKYRQRMGNSGGSSGGGGYSGHNSGGYSGHNSGGTAGVYGGHNSGVYGGHNSGGYGGHNSGGGAVNLGGSFCGRPREPAGPSVKKCCLHTELCRMLDPRNELKLLLSNSLPTLEKKTREIIY